MKWPEMPEHVLKRECCVLLEMEVKCITSRRQMGSRQHQRGRDRGLGSGKITLVNVFIRPGPLSAIAILAN